MADISEEEFQQKVVDRSASCRWWSTSGRRGARLPHATPLLESEIGSMDGQVELAKVNVDENPGLATQFRVHGIPAVKAFRDGQVMSSFEGARDDRLRPPLGAVARPAAVADALEKARSLVIEGLPRRRRPLLAEIDPRSPYGDEVPVLESTHCPRQPFARRRARRLADDHRRALRRGRRQQARRPGALRRRYPTARDLRPPRPRRRARARLRGANCRS
jgi:thioredoxin-like negative regulator of GroEL